MKLKNSQKRRAAFLVAAFMGIAVALYHPSAVNGKTVQQQADVVATVNALLQIRAEVVATITAIAIQTGDKAPVSTPIATASVGNVSSGSVSSGPIVKVLVKGLNIRSGPGTGFAVVGNANAGQQFSILGQSGNCAWLKIGTPNSERREVGWISGGSQYTSYTTACKDIPAANQASLPVATARPAPTSAKSTSDQIGCYIIENQLALQLTIQLSRADGWKDSFQLASGATREYCAEAGTYTYTISLPPPLSNISGELKINAGDRFYLPLKL